MNSSSNLEEVHNKYKMKSKNENKINLLKEKQSPEEKKKGIYKNLISGVLIINLF